ncbi:hypothetical protein TWF718_002902 [Orbilia javanica]|uniref:Uncharacterized protein n=1 Tax=Orbilia javanica TaxID=47235 RepID=A0AAN8MGU1_9PEZI
MTETPEEAYAVTRGVRRSMTTDAVRETARRTSKDAKGAEGEPRSASTPASKEIIRIPMTTMSIANRRSFSSEPDTTTQTPEGVKPRKRERPALFLDLKKDVKPEPEPEKPKPRKRLWPFRRSWG